MTHPTDAVLSVIFSNLSKAAEKQKLPEDSGFFTRLSKEFWTAEPVEGDLTALKGSVESDLETGYSAISEAAADEVAGDAGAQRCVKWGEKVSSIQKSLLNRYASKGDALFEGKNLYICEACGFIALGEDFPELCPVCKAPKSQFSKVR